MATESPQTRYDRANCVSIAVKLNRKTDKEILERLAAEPNKQGYIKKLIRADIEAAQQDNDAPA